MQRPVYLDYNATTPVDPLVLAAMMPYLTEEFGNASSAHAYGFEARAAVDRARSQVAAFLHARSEEIVFTGGGSETDTLAITGVVLSRLHDRPHVISTRVEHPAVLHTLSYLHRRFGVEYSLLDVDEYGLVTASAVERAIRPETVLVTVMHANNEVGTIQPVEEIGLVTRASDVLFHVDAAQSAGKVPIRVADLNVDLLTIAGHKLYAPKGVGALYVRRGTPLDPVIHGSGQEGGLRAGTENVAGIAGLGRACEIAQEHLQTEARRIAELRDLLFDLLSEALPDAILNGHPEQRLPNTLNVTVPGATGAAILAYAPGVAASTGAACHSGEQAPSGTLTAMGIGGERARGAIRLSLGRRTTESDVRKAAAELIRAHAEVVAPSVTA